MRVGVWFLIALLGLATPVAAQAPAPSVSLEAVAMAVELA